MNLCTGRRIAEMFAYSVAVMLILTCGSVAAQPAASEGKGDGHGDGDGDGGSDADAQASVTLSTAMRLGQLPMLPGAQPSRDEPLTLAWGEIEGVPEIDVHGGLPAAGDVVTLGGWPERAWQQVETTDDSGFAADGPGVFWLAAALHNDRWCEITITATGAGSIFVDGELIAGGSVDDPAEAPDTLTGSITAGRGTRHVFVRAVQAADDVAVTVSAQAAPAAQLRWSLVERRALSDFDQTRFFATPQNLAIANDGRLIARRLSRRRASGEARTAGVEVFDRKGNLVAAGLGGEGARPIAFTPDGKQLLLRRSGADGSDLLLWTAPAGPLQTVLSDEPGLGLVRFSPDGRFLLLASSRGFTAREHDNDSARRWLQARERVPDFRPGPHLHLVALDGAARRVLTWPGDEVLDDAVFLPDGERVVYGRTVPRTEHPWFHTDIVVLDLKTAEERTLCSFAGGWEVRPQGFAPHPDGRRLAFLGPPDEVGGDRAPHNVYHKQVWLLDLETGSYERITQDGPYAYEAGGGLPRWDRSGRLLTEAIAGSRVGLVRLRADRDDWRAEWQETAAQETAAQEAAPATLGPVAVSADGGSVVYSASGPTAPAALYWQKIGKSAQLIEEPNAVQTERWLLAATEDASFTGPGGENIEAWWYRPVGGAEGREADAGTTATAGTPLIVYYYCGSVATMRSFNTTHQFLAANGYAVLVINSRGARGYGDEFADHHAGDWGPRAGADVIAGTEALLAAHPELDGDRVGIYGGSYGGFLTEYLVTVSSRFAAAVSMYGISDLATYWGQGEWGWTYGDMALAGATPWADSESFLRTSPLFHADKITTPLLLLHGKDDSNVTPGESVQLFTALTILDRPVEMVLFPGEGHGISGSWANRVLHRTMLLEWFDRWLMDQPEAWAQRWE